MTRHQSDVMYEQYCAEREAWERAESARGYSLKDDGFTLRDVKELVAKAYREGFDEGDRCADLPSTSEVPFDATDFIKAYVATQMKLAAAKLSNPSLWTLKAPTKPPEVWYPTEAEIAEALKQEQARSQKPESLATHVPPSIGSALQGWVFKVSILDFPLTDPGYIGAAVLGGTSHTEITTNPSKSRSLLRAVAYALQDAARLLLVIDKEGVTRG